ncbi:MAG: ABC transporter C-terminal domain-containing protein [Coprobacter sp.]
MEEQKKLELSEKNKKTKNETKQIREVTTSKRRLSFKEKREFEELEISISRLEEEKSNLEIELSSGTLSNDELLEKSKRISVLIDEIDEKTMRWLELSEIES